MHKFPARPQATSRQLPPAPSWEDAVQQGAREKQVGHKSGSAEETAAPRAPWGMPGLLLWLFHEPLSVAVSGDLACRRARADFMLL